MQRRNLERVVAAVTAPSSAAVKVAVSAAVIRNLLTVIHRF